MKRDFYADSIENFRRTSTDEILGCLVKNNEFPSTPAQRDAWLEEIRILKEVLRNSKGSIYFEYSIPRMGRRIDVVILIGPVIFVLEFKVGESSFNSIAVDQVWDYSLDLKNFHESSHDRFVAPILIATQTASVVPIVAITPQNDKLLFPIKCNIKSIPEVIEKVLAFADGNEIDAAQWENGRYSPTPTIIEAAMALYNGHNVSEISRNDAGAINLSSTTDTVSNIISLSKEKSEKSICFVTGVPGAGKTLVGLNIATQHFDKKDGLHSVFLSGNGPLVAVLREALARDKVRSSKEMGEKIAKSTAYTRAKIFIQNVHNFRDECLIDLGAPPEHVVLFDEAQRAWNLEQTANFMRRRKNRQGFRQSEPEFLISCLDRHRDWAVIVCLVGGGQEINTGEAGIGEWVDALVRSFPKWRVYLSPQLTDSEYGAGEVLEKLRSRSNVVHASKLHLAVSMRSFRAEHVSTFVKQVLELDLEKAKDSFVKIKNRYPIVITRELYKAKEWLKLQARGSERYGIVVSSQAERLKPHAIDVKSPMNPIHWFLNGKEDVRSSYYLEDVATEFHVQGLELDWACVTWDADFRYNGKKWEHWSFRGDRWDHIRKSERQGYLKNAYRVLLTRARQGMAIVVPNGDHKDPTRNPKYYDPTYEFLCALGIPVL
jgi:hypothetical protein